MRRPRLSPSTCVWVIVAALWAVSAGLLGWVGRLPAPDLGTARGPLWLLVFAAAFFCTEEACAHVEFRGQATTFALCEVPLVIGLFFLPPLALVGTQFVGVALAFALRRRQPPQKLLFNVALYSLEAELALIVFHAVAGAPAQIGQRAWLAALVAVVAQSTVGTVAISVVIRTMDDTARLRDVFLPHLLDLAGGVAVTTMSLSAVLIVAIAPGSLWLLLCTWALLVAAYREIVSSRERQQSLSFLYEASRKLSADAGFDTVVLSLLDEVTGRFRAELAELVLVGRPDASMGVRTTVGPGGRREAMRSVQLDEAEVEFLGAGDRSECTVVQADDDGPLAAILHARGVREAMLVRLTADGTVLGMLLVANRLGRVASGFGPGDRTLFLTLAGHVRTALDNGRLETHVSRLTELKDELSHQAFHDPLTGLANRALFTSRVDQALAAPVDAGSRVAVLFIDLDDFKTVNDTMGHAAGDELLAQVAGLVRAALRPTDTAARLGGDEFAVCLPAVRDPQEVTLVASRLLDSLATPIVVEGRPMWVRGSIGVAIQDGEAGETAELLRRADVAMYMAKMKGKSRFEIYDAGMHEQVSARHTLKADLQRAVDRDEFVVHYQPVVDVETGAVTGAEALVRWRHPARGLLLPGEFLPLAEEMGLAGVIGGRVLRTACEQLRAWQDADPGRALSMSVQVATAQLRQSSFTAEVADAVARSGVDAASLVLEIASAALGGDADGWRETLSALKSLGVRLAVDDFGTGYAPLSHVGDLPFDVLKVAKTFVDGLDRGERRAALCEAVIAMGQSLRLVVVADGVERPEQLRALRRLGCVRAQGHLLGRPVPAAELTPLLVLELAPR
ncbi:MAG: hypothetical protein QOE45_116 [Frankiaceae bacterium]|jgi:diguanylate cyclase (GGDEF)-like protein|nr:hypothetical protein [Frankiaceae bacterium]